MNDFGSREAAEKAMEKICKQLGGEFRPIVWENMGWYGRAYWRRFEDGSHRGSGTYIKVMERGTKLYDDPNKRYHAEVHFDPPFQTGCRAAIQIYGDGKTPVEAVQAAMIELSKGFSNFQSNYHWVEHAWSKIG